MILICDFKKFLRYAILITTLVVFCLAVSVLSAMYILVSGFGDKVKENPDVAALFAWLPDNVRRVHPIFIYLSLFFFSSFCSLFTVSLTCRTLRTHLFWLGRRVPLLNCATGDLAN